MNRPADSVERRDRAIAALLWYGTWIACAIIAAGIAWETLQQSGYLPFSGVGGRKIVEAGVALFILLPIARVALMLLIFLRERDYVYTGISALVLAIILAGIVIAI